MTRARFQRLLYAFALGGLLCVGPSARAQESTNFASFTAESADLVDLDPVCTGCATLVVEGGLKAGADPISVAAMDDETTIEMVAVRPDTVSGGPDPVVSMIEGEADGIETEVTTEDMELKAGGKVKLARKIKLKLKVKPNKRQIFPQQGAVNACDPAKAYKKGQLGWQTVRLATAYKTKAGKAGITKAKPVMVCVRTPAGKPASCSLKCGQGTCVHKVKGSTWSEWCDCKAGYLYSDTAKTCSDVNECTTKGLCPTGTTCENRPGDFVCGCAANQVLTINGCKVPPVASCGPTLQCTGGKACRKTGTKTSCECPPKTVLAAGICQPVSACAIDSCGNGKGVRCVDRTREPAMAPGEYTCECPKGAVYKAGPTPGKGQCVDVDECKLANIAQYCGTAKCANMDAVNPSKTAVDGAKCGTKAIPPASSISSAWSIPQMRWE